MSVASHPGPETPLRRLIGGLSYRAELYRRAKQILGERRAGLEAGAEALIQRETLSGTELGAIADAAVIRERNEKAKSVDAA